MSDNFAIKIIDRNQKTQGPIESSELSSNDFINKVIYDSDNVFTPLIKERIGIDIFKHIWRLNGPSDGYIREPDFFIDYFSNILKIIKEKNNVLPKYYWIKKVIEGYPTSKSNRFYPIKIDNEEWIFESDWESCIAKSKTGKKIDILSQEKRVFRGIYVGKNKNLKGKDVELIIEEQTFLDRFEHEILECIKACKKAKSENKLVYAEIS
jgi:hypothetical protein